MSLGRNVPWVSWEEWEQVGQWLLGEDAISVRSGLDRVAAWRVRGRVPLGVEATSMLVETRLSDACNTLPDIMLRSQYSLALVRMVNGIADSSQRGRVASSVASLAGAAGLPRILVDLRHEATHNELPSLPALRLAAREALAWLREQYWRRQLENVHACEGKIAAVLTEYVTSHLAAALKAARSGRQRCSSDDEATPSDATNATKTNAGNSQLVSAPLREEGKSDAADTYNAVVARRQRQALLTELRTLVPQPAAALLVEGLLRAPQLTSAVACLVGTQPDTSSSLAEKSVDLEVVAVAMRHCLRHLSDEWPHLRGILLDAVATRCSLFIEKNSAGGLDAHQLSLWTRVLLPEATIDDRAFTHDAVAFSNLAEAVATKFLKAYALAVASSPFVASDSLLEADDAISDFIRALLIRILDQNRRTKLQSAWEMMKDSVTASSGMPVVGRDHDALDSELQILSQQLIATRDKVVTSIKACKRSREEAVQADVGHGSASNLRLRSRWARVKDWKPCAIGMLPSNIDPNGRVPALHAVAPLRREGDALHGAVAGENSRPRPVAKYDDVVERTRELPQEVWAPESEIGVVDEDVEDWPVRDRFTLAAERHAGLDGLTGGDDVPQQHVLPVDRCPPGKTVLPLAI